MEISVEVAQKSRSPAALLSHRGRRNRAAKDAAGPKNTLCYGSVWGGSKVLLAKPGSFLVNQERDLSASAEAEAASGGCCG